MKTRWKPIRKAEIRLIQERDRKRTKFVVSHLEYEIDPLYAWDLKDGTNERMHEFSSFSLWFCLFILFTATFPSSSCDVIRRNTQRRVQQSKRFCVEESRRKKTMVKWREWEREKFVWESERVWESEKKTSILFYIFFVYFESRELFGES